jgi:Ca-activated chloride channel homolog
MKTSILLDHEPADAGRVVRLLLRLEAAATGRADRLPLNLSLVLDRSGSMHGGKLEAACAAAALLVRRLSPDDVVSVVAYDDAVCTIAEPATGAAQASLPREIESIETGGSTNLS